MFLILDKENGEPIYLTFSRAVAWISCQRHNGLVHARRGYHGIQSTHEWEVQELDYYE